MISAKNSAFKGSNKLHFMEEHITCQICGKQKKPDDVLPVELVNDKVAETGKKKYPNWSDSGYVCLSDLNSLRMEYIKQSMEEERGELTDLEKEVLKSIQEHEIISKNINVDFQEKLSFGDKLADRVAMFVGSWKFISIFFAFIFAWAITNAYLLLAKPFDPYPFILLNLILSCVAAIQAPLILMSQNRQSRKDRINAEHDYKVNLKAEMEIRHLNAKVDELLTHQWQRLLEIQRIQTEMMEEIVNKDKNDE